MQRDIVVETAEQMAAICIMLTEAGHGFEARQDKHGAWIIRLTGAF